METYRLKPDAAMLQELANQQKLVKLTAEREKQVQKQFESDSAKRIFDLTGGQLKRGMTREEVISRLGKPESDSGPIHPRTTARNPAYIIFTYPDLVLTFRTTTFLIDAQKRAK